mgnify:FL=1
MPATSENIRPNFLDRGFMEIEDFHGLGISCMDVARLVLFYSQLIFWLTFIANAIITITLMSQSIDKSLKVRSKFMEYNYMVIDNTIK